MVNQIVIMSDGAPCKFSVMTGLCLSFHSGNRTERENTKVTTEATPAF